MEVKNEIYQNIEEIMEKQNISLSEDSDWHNDFGGISIRVDIGIDISHIENFYDALQKLIDYNNSPIANDGYTGTDIHQPYGSDIIYYIIEYGYVFEDFRDVSIKILKENCDDKMVDAIIYKVDKLHSLGFYNITLSYSYFMEEQFEKRVEEEANDITAGYYELEDEEILKIKYKILNIK